MRILIVEDSKVLRDYLALGLRRAGFAVDTLGDGRAALHQIEEVGYDVVILDRMLPGLNGDAVLVALRQQACDCRVLILSARDRVEDRIEGLELGADDYLIKPFAFDELLARVRTLVRRRYDVLSPEIALGDLRIHLTRKEVFKKGTSIPLPPREFALLEYLAVRRGQLVSRTEIEQHIYDDRVEPMSNVVDAAIYCLRRRIDDRTGPSLIKTRRGQGYILETIP